MDWSDIVTGVVALYGAVLSTSTAVVSGYLAYCRWREKIPSLKVEVSTRVDHGTERVFVEASNPGERVVVLSSKGFFLPGHKQPFRPSWRDYGADFREPYELVLEHRCEWHMPARILAERLRSMGFAGRVKLVGFYEDQVGRSYKSQPFKFDVDHYG